MCINPRHRTDCIPNRRLTTNGYSALPGDSTVLYPPVPLSQLQKENISKYSPRSGKHTYTSSTILNSSLFPVLPSRVGICNDAGLPEVYGVSRSPWISVGSSGICGMPCLKSLDARYSPSGLGGGKPNRG